MGRLADDGPQLGGHTATMNVIRNCQPRHGSASNAAAPPHHVNALHCRGGSVVDGLADDGPPTGWPHSDNECPQKLPAATLPPHHSNALHCRGTAIVGRLADDGPQLGGHTATMNVIRNCQPRRCQPHHSNALHCRGTAIVGRLADDGPQLGGHTATMNVLRNCQPRRCHRNHSNALHCRGTAIVGRLAERWAPTRWPHSDNECHQKLPSRDTAPLQRSGTTASRQCFALQRRFRCRWAGR